MDTGGVDMVMTHTNEAPVTSAFFLIRAER